MIFIIILLLIILFYLKVILNKELKKVLIFIVLILIELGYCVYWFVPVSFSMYKDQPVSVNAIGITGYYDQPQPNINILGSSEQLKLTSQQIEFTERQKQELIYILLESKLHRCYNFQVSNGIFMGETFYLSVIPKYKGEWEYKREFDLHIYAGEGSRSFAVTTPDDFISNLLLRITNGRYMPIDYFKISNSEKIAEFLNNLQ